MATNQNEDRVKQATPNSINQKIEAETWNRIAEFGNKSSSEITERIHELEKDGT